MFTGIFMVCNPRLPRDIYFKDNGILERQNNDWAYSTGFTYVRLY